jgi:hypothetical protein
MSGKSIRAIMTVVLLALVMTIPSLTRVVPSSVSAERPAMIMVEEHGTTAS